MSNITRRALRVYAALAELSPNSEDVLDSLLPFFEPILEAMNGRVFHPALFAVGVRKLYRWRFTADIAERFIPRFLKVGYLTAEGSQAKGVYIVRFKSPEIASEQAVVSVVEEIVTEFSAFASILSHTVEYKRDKEYLTDVLVRFLVSLDIYQPETFKQEIAKIRLQTDDASPIEEIEEGGQPLEKEDRYLAARFVQHICNARPELVSHLARLASIGLLTEVVEDFLHPVQRRQNIDLTLIVDAPLALDYLGCSGVIPKTDVRQIFDSLRQVGVRLVVFPTSLIEMQRNLQSMLNAKHAERHGPTHEAMLKREVSEEFVRAVANNPQNALENVGFQVRQIELDHFPNLHKYFSEEQYEDFFSAIQWVSDVAPREHDATCLALTMRLREGRNSSDAFQCRYVFVTRNPRYARFARSYCIQGRLITSLQEGPIIGQRELATITWLRTGLGAGEAVPRGHLLATCDRVLRVRPEVRDAVVSRLKSYTPDKAEEMSLLLLDQKSLRRLADETFNDESVITDENVETLFQAVKSAALEIERKEFEEALQTERDRAASQISIKDRDIESARWQYINAIETKESMEAALSAMSDEQKTRILALARMVSNDVKYIEYLSWAVLAVIVSIGATNYFTGWLSNYASFAAFFGVIIAVFAMYHQSMNFLGRPKIAVVSILEVVARRRFLSILGQLDLEKMIIRENIDFSKGQVRMNDNSFVGSLPKSNGSAVSLP